MAAEENPAFWPRVGRKLLDATPPATGWGLVWLYWDKIRPIFAGWPFTPHWPDLGRQLGEVGPVWPAMCAFILFVAVTIALEAWLASRRAKCKFTMKYEPDRAGTIHRPRDGGERDLVYFNVKNTSDAPVEDCTIRIAVEKDGTDEYRKYKTYIGQQPFQLLIGEPDRAGLISLPRHAPNLPATLNNFYRTGDRWLNQAVNLTPGDYTFFVQAFAENSAPPPAITLRLLHRAGYWQNPTEIKLPRHARI